MFQLHPTLEKDSLPVFETDALLIRLINDARFPWGLVVPRIAGMSELHDLPDEVCTEALQTSVKLGRVMKAAFAADKINTAAIGNMVPQLHLHVVARTRGDAAWPGPVWGAGAMVPLDVAEADRRISLIREGMS